MKDSVTDRWYATRPRRRWIPLSFLFRFLVWLRQFLFKVHLLPSYGVDVPVIVVGNISVGGTGKTPMVVWLVKLLKKAGYQPGIVTRGYGGQAERWPQQVRPDSDPMMVGDEPVLLAQRCDCPIVASPDRVEAARSLLKHARCDVLISDDGLQHYRLKRDIEFVIIDGERRFGNGYCLPAGPLREPLSRLGSIDYKVTNGQARNGEFAMTLVPGLLTPLFDLQRGVSLDAFQGKSVHAVAGIGNPLRFFNMLRSFGMDVIEHAFDDHHPFQLQDLRYDDQLPVIMTEKDAVKCRHITDVTSVENIWYLPVDARLDEALAHRVLRQLKTLIR